MDYFFLNLFLGSATYILGLIFQVVIIVRDKTMPKTIIRISSLLLFTLISSIAISLIIWKFWIFKIDIMFGPILLPALISEIILSPVILRLFGYRIIKR